jgi:L-threonylcarbamoyladenylate synthase
MGLRVPSLASSLGPLEAVGLPVLQSSANRSGEPAVCRLGDLPVELLEQADLVLDGGELPGTASTVVDLRSYGQTGAWSVVREGALPVDALQRALLLAS